MRLIDADAMKETIESFVDTMSVCPNMDYCNGLRAMKEMAIKEVLEQPTASPWHRVEEPPKENGRYLVSWEGAITSDEYKNGVWLYASMFNQRVTHWMLIPEPPKED